MQILRLPPYPLSVSYTVPESNQDYVLVIEDTTEQSEVVVYLTSNSSSKITYTLDGDFVKYDKSYSLTVYEDLQETGNVIEDRGDIVVQDNLEIARPYVNPTELATKYGATTASEIAKYEEYESLARVIIDSITGGFYCICTSILIYIMIRLDFDCIWIRSHYLVIKYCLSLYLTQLQCFLCPGSFIHFAVLIYLDFCIQLKYCPVPIALYYASAMCSLGYMQYSNENWITMKHYEIYSYSE